MDGNIHHGRSNIAGEWGHHCLHTGGNNCYCGNKGCVETYISGPALEKKWSNMTNQNQSLPEIIKNSDNPYFDNWKKSFLDNFALSLSNVIDILDPDIVILGGGLSNINFLYDEGKNAVYEKVFSDIVDTPIVKNELGHSAGVFGACLLSPYCGSIVAGGLLEITYETHVTSSISFVILLLIFSKTPLGSLVQSAVIASIESTTLTVTILPYLRSSPTTPTALSSPTAAYACHTLS